MRSAAPEERENFIRTNIYRNTMHTIETKVKWQAARTGWPPCEKKKRKHIHITQKLGKSNTYLDQSNYRQTAKMPMQPIT